MQDMTSNSHNPQQQPPGWADLLTGILAATALGAIALIAVRSLGAGHTSTPRTVLSTSANADLCRSVHDAYLSGTLFGAVNRSIEWRGTDMRCEGGSRPGGDGIRLVFAAPDEADGDRLVFVIGISGSVDELTEAERLANVTVIDESSGRFFSSRGQDRCWTTVASVNGDGTRFRIGGEFYCSGSLPSLSDGSSISLRDFRYSGRLSLDAS